MFAEEHCMQAMECNKDGRRVTKADRGKKGTYMCIIRPNAGFSAGNMAYQGAPQRRA